MSNEKDNNEMQDLELETLMAQPPSGNARKQKRKPWSRKKKLVGGAVAGIAIFLTATRIFGANNQLAAVVMTTTLSKGTIQNKLSLSGPVSGTDSAEVVSNLHAEIEEILVKEGDKVAKGQILARLNTEDVKREVDVAGNRYELAVANYDEAQRDAVSGYEKAQQDHKAAEDNFERVSVLYHSGSVPLVEYETARNQLNDTRRQLESCLLEAGRPVAAKSYILEVKNARFELEQKQKLLDETEIKSPIAGTVIRVNSRVGRFADVVDDDKPLFAIDNLETLELKINVSEYSIGKVELGQTAVIRADILSGAEEEGVVASISPTGEEKGGGSTERVIPITIKILNNDTGLIAGITAKAELTLEEAEDAWAAPISAVFHKDGEKYVAVVEHGAIRLIPVATGVEGDIQIQISGDTLTEGMRLITNPDASMADGQLVTEQPLG